MFFFFYLSFFPQVFLQDLVRNLFGEGNDVFSEGDWARSVEHYTEALGVSEYAESEEINIPCKMRERLHANRAAAYLHMVSAYFCIVVGGWVGGCSVGVRAAVKDPDCLGEVTVMPHYVVDSNATYTQIQHETEIVFVQHADMILLFLIYLFVYLFLSVVL